MPHRRPTPRKTPVHLLYLNLGAAPTPTASRETAPNPSPSIEPPQSSIDLWDVYRTQGGRAALEALNAFVDRPMRAWGKKSIQDLQKWAMIFSGAGVWGLAVPCWVALLLILKAEGEREQRAYFFNDLGTAFTNVLDPRGLPCFHRALRLTKSPGRRMRTLRRIGRALALVKGDFERARRYLYAALRVGLRYRADPAVIESIKEDLIHLEPRFTALRRDLAPNRNSSLARALGSLDPSAL
jgi:hypothetical protein